MDNTIIYFAAHAPEIPEWFQIENKAPHPERVQTPYDFIRHHDESKFIRRYFDDDNFEYTTNQEEQFCVPTDKIELAKLLKNEIDQHIEKYEKYKKECDEWRMSEAMYKLVQWRFYYANEMFYNFIKNNGYNESERK